MEVKTAPYVSRAALKYGVISLLSVSIDAGSLYTGTREQVASANELEATSDYGYDGPRQIYFGHWR